MKFPFKIKHFNTKTFLYYPLVISLIVVLGVVSSFYGYKKSRDGLRGSLLRNVSALAIATGSDTIDGLYGDQRDTENENYLDFKVKLKQVAKLYKDLRFLYVTGIRDGNIFFYADSEDVASPDYSYPGEIYTDATDQFRNVFSTKQAIISDVYSDRWGRWLTAIAPIVNKDTGEVVAVVAVDMNAIIYYQTIAIYTILPIMITIIILILISIGYFIRKNEQVILDLKTQIVSIASHEIRTPLTGINWTADTMLRHKDNLHDDQIKNLESIKQNSRNLLTTINDLLDMTAMDAQINQIVTKDIFLLYPVCADIFANFELAFKQKNLRAKIAFEEEDVFEVYGNKEQCARMLSNLIANGIKYSKENSCITVDVKDNVDSVIISIHDEGIGIPKADQGKIFDGFFRASNAKEFTKNGTGLGLHYVAKIINLHDGKIWYESEEDKGSTFYVELPKEKKKGLFS